jgi:hypothetical protein
MNDKLNFSRPLSLWDRSLLLTAGVFGFLLSLLVVLGESETDATTLDFLITLLALAQLILFALLFLAFWAVADLLALVHGRPRSEADDSTENVLEEADPEANGDVLTQGPEARAEEFIRRGRRNPPAEPE